MPIKFGKPFLLVIVLNVLVGGEVVLCRVWFDASPGVFQRFVEMSGWVVVPVAFLLVISLVQMLRLIERRRKLFPQRRAVTRSAPETPLKTARRQSDMQIQLLGVLVSAPVCFLIFWMLRGAPVLARDFQKLLLESAVYFALWFVCRMLWLIKKTDRRRMA